MPNTGMPENLRVSGLVQADLGQLISIKAELSILLVLPVFLYRKGQTRCDRGVDQRIRRALERWHALWVQALRRVKGVPGGREPGSLIPQDHA